MTEVKMPLWRIVEYRDGAVYRTEPAGEAWVPVENAKSGTQWGDDPDVRLGTPDKFEVRNLDPGRFRG